MQAFDGGVFVIRDRAGQVASHAGIKNKGLIHEIAVGTQPEHRKRGMGQAVVASALAHILAQGKVPVYIVTSFMDIYSIDRYVTWNVQAWVPAGTLGSRRNWFSAGGLTFYSSRNLDSQAVLRTLRVLYGPSGQVSRLRDALRASPAPKGR